MQLERIDNAMRYLDHLDRPFAVLDAIEEVDPQVREGLLFLLVERLLLQLHVIMPDWRRRQLDTRPYTRSAVICPGGSFRGGANHEILDCIFVGLLDGQLERDPRSGRARRVYSATPQQSDPWQVAYADIIAAGVKAVIAGQWR